MPSRLAPPSRRDFLKVSFGGLLGAFLANAVGARDARADGAPKPKAKACVLLWMNGGPSHIDTWDPKPGTQTGGPFKAIRTQAPAIQLAQHLPQVGEQANHIAIVRSMSSREGNHQRARQFMHTGYTPNPTADHPSLGGWVAHERINPNFDLPSSVSVGGPGGDAGFLGVEYAPLIVRANQPPENVAYAKLVDSARFDRRLNALGALDAEFEKETGDPRVKERDAVYGHAVRLMRAPSLGAFDLGSEPDSTKKGYGDTEFGRGCLLARRLLEAGVSFVEVTLDGWDTHQDNFKRTEKLMGTLDPAMASLIKDLDDRKLLDQTIILLMGEFGRTPTINAADGRDHYPQAWSTVLAGGGIRGGTVIGATDALGARPDNPLGVPDLLATVVTQLGIDPAMSLSTRTGRPISVTDSGKPIPGLV